MSTPASHAEPGAGNSTPVFGTLLDAQTYKNLAYLFLRFPLGVAYFTVLVTLASTGLSLAVLVVGFAVLAFILPVVTYCGSLEAALARQLLGWDVSYDRPDPGAKPVVPYLETVLTDARSYFLLGYVFLTFPVGLALFVTLTVLFTFAGASLVAPLAYASPWFQYELPLDPVTGAGPFVVDTLPEALLVSGLGLVVGIATLYLCNALARLHGAVTARVLD